MRKHAVVVTAAIAIIAAGIIAFRPAVTEVDVATVSAGRLQVTIDEDGETRVIDRFVVSAPVSGRVTRIEIEPGTAVVGGKTVVASIAPSSAPLLDARTRGELVATLSTATAAVGQARAERDRASAVLDRAEMTLRRQETLVQSGAISRDELEAGATAVKTARSVLRAADYAVARAERERQTTAARLQTPPSTGPVVQIVAPVDGVVLRRLHESEAVVPIGEPLLEIGNPQCLEIVADLLSTDAVRVSTGDPVSIERWGGPAPIPGRVRRVEPSGFTKISALGVEEQRVNVVIDFAEGGTAQALGDGYRVEIRISVWDKPDVLKIPLGSLFRRGSEWAVFIMTEGRAKVREVAVGQRNGEEAQVLGGLRAGDVVVLYPPDTLADGARVATRTR